MLLFKPRLSLTRMLVGLGILLSSTIASISPAAAACQAGTPSCVLPVPGAAPLSVAQPPPPVVIDDDDGGGIGLLPILLGLVVIGALVYFLVLDDDDDPVSP